MSRLTEAACRVEDFARSGALAEARRDVERWEAEVRSASVSLERAAAAAYLETGAAQAVAVAESKLARVQRSLRLARAAVAGLVWGPESRGSS